MPSFPYWPVAFACVARCLACGIAACFLEFAFAAVRHLVQFDISLPAGTDSRQSRGTGRSLFACIARGLDCGLGVAGSLLPRWYYGRARRRIGYTAVSLEEVQQVHPLGSFVSPPWRPLPLPLGPFGAGRVHRAWGRTLGPGEALAAPESEYSA